MDHSQKIELTATQEFHQLKTQVGDIDDKVDRVLNVLTGNVLDKSDSGMIGKVKELQVKVISLEKWKDRLVYIIAGASAFGGYGVIEIFKAIASIITKHPT